MMVAACPPTSHAAGWRLQNWVMSETAAVAACTASAAPICGSLSDSGVLSLGRSTSTSPSQNVMRSKKRILRTCMLDLAHGDLREVSDLATLDKSQVIAFRLIRGKFTQKS